MASNEQRVLVGIDDSATGRRALCWAVDEAAALGVELDVVHVYDLPVVLTPAPLPPPRTETLYEQQATDLLHRLVSEALAAAPRRPPAVQEIAGGRARGRALVGCAKAADVLVVGSRGRGQMASVVLGSVGQYCVHHAPCRVVVVPSRVHV